MNQFDLWKGIEQFEGKNYTGIYVDFQPIPDEITEGFKKITHTEAFEMQHRGEEAYIMYINVLENYQHIEQETFDTY